MHELDAIDTVRRLGHARVKEEYHRAMLEYHEDRSDGGVGDFIHMIPVLYHSLAYVKFTWRADDLSRELSQAGAEIPGTFMTSLNETYSGVNP